MIRFIAHTVREFSTENDFDEFVAYLRSIKAIPSDTIDKLMKDGSATIRSDDGENCPAISEWWIEQ